MDYCMAVDKFQHKIIFSLKMQLIFTYIIVNLPIWYLILYFFVYSHKIPFFGIKIIAAIFSVVSIVFSISLRKTLSAKNLRCVDNLA